MNSCFFSFYVVMGRLKSGQNDLVPSLSWAVCAELYKSISVIIARNVNWDRKFHIKCYTREKSTTTIVLHDGCAAATFSLSSVYVCTVIWLHNSSSFCQEEGKNNNLLPPRPPLLFNSDRFRPWGHQYLCLLRRCPSSYLCKDDLNFVYTRLYFGHCFLWF